MLDSSRETGVRHGKGVVRIQDRPGTGHEAGLLVDLDAVDAEDAAGQRVEPSEPCRGDDRDLRCVGVRSEAIPEPPRRSTGPTRTTPGVGRGKTTLQCKAMTKNADCSGFTTSADVWMRARNQSSAMSPDHPDRLRASTLWVLNSSKHSPVMTVWMSRTAPSPTVTHFAMRAGESRNRPASSPSLAMHPNRMNLFASHHARTLGDVALAHAGNDPDGRQARHAERMKPARHIAEAGRGQQPSGPHASPVRFRSFPHRRSLGCRIRPSFLDMGAEDVRMAVPSRS